MESYTAVDLVTVLIALVLFIGVPAVAVYREKSELTMRRRDFVLWVVLYLIVLPVVANIVAKIMPSLAVEGVLVLVGLWIAYIFYQRVVRRARDAGMGKRIAYIGAIPVANLVVFVILMVTRSAQPGGTAQTAEA